MALASLEPASADAPPLQSRVLAGSGASGIDDGPAANATFLMPAQVAYSPTGTLYVVDSAAQRVRAVAPDGMVTTIAGGGAIGVSGVWVDGAFRDGPARDARFNHPDGIAVAPNGTVFVADRDNRCIRSIANGVVTTIAGVAGNAGNDDGARGSGRFASPRSLTLDRDGMLYVADWGAGLRRVAPDGSVVTLHPTGATIDRATGITVSHAGSVTELDVADALGIVRIALPALTATRVAAFPTGTETAGPPVAGDVPLGVPHAIAALAPGEVVFTDLRDSSVKYLRLTSYLRYLGATPAEDAMNAGGGPGFDGSLPRYDSPMGVAIDAHGAIAIADTGNRRIVTIAPFDRRAYLTASNFDKLDYEPNRYRVAVIGSSFTWFNSSGPDSIAGLLQQRLLGVPALASRPPSTRYFQIGRLNSEFDLMDNVFGFGAADLVVFVLSPVDPYGLGLGEKASEWAPPVRARLEHTIATLRAAHVSVLVAVAPAPQTISPLEAAYLFEGAEADPESNYDSQHQDILGVLHGLDVPVLDLYPIFRAELAKPDRRPLFSTSDVHYSPYGRGVVAGAIFAELERLQPWASR